VRLPLVLALLAGALTSVVGLAPANAEAASSAGGVQIGARQIVVTAPSGARAIVTRDPFSLAVLDASGRTVLREVAAAAGLPAAGATTLPAVPTPIAPVSQSEFGAIGPAPPTTYAPLTFLVGSQTVTQTPAGQWEGTLGSVTESGVEYSARSVLDVRRQGNGVLLTLATNDPTGRHLIVSIGPRSAGALEVGARPSPATGVATMSDSFSSSAGEAFRGFGGRHNSLDQHGSEFYNWLNQENISSGDAAAAAPGQERNLFPNGPEAAYYVQSSFVSSRGYGFLLDRDEISHWRMDSDRPDAWQVEVGAPALDYVVAPGASTSAITQLTALTGRQPVPPSWATGSIFDRLVKYPSDPAASYQQEVQSDIDNIDRYHLHVDAYRIEGWAELPTAVLAHDIAELRARGIHPLVYFRAFVGQDTTGTDDPADYTYALAHGYVATHSDGSPYTFISNFNDDAAMIDFTNPAAVRWWQSRITAALNLGADGFMQDFGEQVLTGMHFHDGSTGVTMHNRLPVLYDRATRQAIDAYQRTHPKRKIFFYTRAGYSGTPGDAAYENANFPGDETTDWTRSSGLASQTPDMLNRAIGGAFGFSTDIGGYFDVGPYQATTKELFLRWAEWAALSPMFRLHGSLLAGTHTPWSYDPQTVQIYEQLVALHRRAQPLILKLWRQADQTGIPITRPLWLAYPGDARAAAQDQEWLLGPRVLVAPVVTQGATSVPVYFPRGCWRRPDTGTTYRGPSSAVVPVTLGQLAYFFTCGTKPFAVAAPAACPSPPGRLSATRLGPLRLGETRRAVLRRLGPHRTHGRSRRHMNSFCPAGQVTRVVYPSPRLLGPLGTRERRRLAGRAVLILTANRRYTLAGVHAGDRVRSRAARRSLRRARRYRVGGNTWYLVSGRSSTGVLKVSRGVVGEVGIADRRLTAARGEAIRFLRSFG
jgi:alpha-glucosidase